MDKKIKKIEQNLRKKESLEKMDKKRKSVKIICYSNGQKSKKIHRICKDEKIPGNKEKKKINGRETKFVTLEKRSIGIHRLEMEKYLGRE
jgi:hypothetical protein